MERSENERADVVTADTVMPAHFVMIELPDGGASGPEVGALVQSCSSALRPGRCVLANEHEDVSAEAVALVSFTTTDRLNVFVEVGSQRRGGGAWLSERLIFGASDRTVDRYRAIGLTIAVLYRELTGGAPSRSHAEPGAVPSGESSSDWPSDTRATIRGWFAVGPYLGSDPSSRVLRFGGYADLGLIPVRPLVLGLSTRYVSANASGVDLTFATLGVGAGGVLELSRTWSIRARAEVLAEKIAAAAEDEVTGTTERKSHWLDGMGGRVDASFWPGGLWGASMSLSAERLSHSTLVTLYGASVTTTSAWSYGAGIGLEIHPFFQ